MDLWVIFIIAACALAAGEITNASFFLAPFAAACLLAAAVDGAGAPTGATVTTFVAASALLFVFVRPIARRHLEVPELARTGVDALVGRSATVLEAVGEDARGTVKLRGEVWTARPAVEGHTFPAGARVEVVAIDGATAVVTGT